MRAIRKRKVMAQSNHRDILDQLKADILDGKYGDGKPLPSAFALMKKFGVASSLRASSRYRDHFPIIRIA